MKKVNATQPYKCIIVQDGAKVFKSSGSKDKVQKEALDWFRFK